MEACVTAFNGSSIDGLNFLSLISRLDSPSCPWVILHNIAFHKSLSHGTVCVWAYSGQHTR
jgi:hypothetical protein